MYIEPNIPFDDINTNKGLSLKMISTLSSFGYSGAILDTTVEKRRLREDDKPKEDSIVVPKTTKQNAAFRVKYKTASTFTIYRRLTLVADTVQVASSLNMSSITSGYDLLAIKTTDVNVFEFACKQLNVDVIMIPIDQMIPFKLDKKVIDEAVRRGICFEFPLSAALQDRTNRRLFMSLASRICTLTRGKNIILSNGSCLAINQKTPNDYMIFAQLMGLSQAKARDCIDSNVRDLLERAKQRRLINGCVNVEESEPNSGLDLAEDEEFIKIGTTEDVEMNGEDESQEDEDDFIPLSF